MPTANITGSAKRTAFESAKLSQDRDVNGGDVGVGGLPRKLTVDVSWANDSANMVTSSAARRCPSCNGLAPALPLEHRYTIDPADYLHYPVRAWLRGQPP